MDLAHRSATQSGVQSPLVKLLAVLRSPRLKPSTVINQGNFILKAITSRGEQYTLLPLRFATALVPLQMPQSLREQLR